MLSRTQPRPAAAPRLTLAEIQNPMIDAYLAALPDGREPRIVASRTVFVADDRAESMRFAETGLARLRARHARTGRARGSESTDELIAAFDVHLGTPDDVVASPGRTARSPARPTSWCRCTRSTRLIHTSCGRSRWSPSRWRRPWDGAGTRRESAEWRDRARSPAERGDDDAADRC